MISCVTTKIIKAWRRKGVLLRMTREMRESTTYIVGVFAKFLKYFQ